MASLSQPGIRNLHDLNIHNWRVPGHFLHCSKCRAERQRQTQQDQNNARARAILMSQPPRCGTHRERLLALSPRLCASPFPGIIKQRGHSTLDTGRIPRRVTIQVPNLNSPVRPDQTPPPPFRPCRKRPSYFSDEPEPAQYFVPEQSEHAQRFIPEQRITQAGADNFWAANSEAIRLASVPTQAPPSPVTRYEISMPGMWPSWADEPNGIDPRFRLQRDEPASPPAVPRVESSPTGIFALLSALALGTLRAVFWRPVRFVLAAQRPGDRPAHPVQQVQPAQQRSPVQSVQSAQSSNAASTTGVASEENGSRVPKRPRLGEGPSDHQTAEFQHTPYGIPRDISRIGRRPISVRNRQEPDPNFNYEGHFSLDAALDAMDDSEDDEYPGSPMDIDSPQPIVSLTTETILARQSFIPGRTQQLTSDEQTPIALNQPEAILASHPTDSINPETTPKLASTVAAARRAVKLFPKDPTAPKARVPSSVEGSASVKTPSPENRLFATPTIERLRHKATVASKSASTRIPRDTDKSRYDNALEFFPNDIVHSLPGLEAQHLPADARKVEHLKRELMERLRQEEIESQNANLRRVGLRRAMSPLISAPSLEWVNRALDAPKNGYFNPRAVHPDAVELKPRDFAKLVPFNAWLNDDCVHSTLCCLAAYINKQASVKPKVDPPKCVAVSSLYWTAFCGDHQKLYPRPFARKWNMTPDNFLDIDTILIPVNLVNHWTLIVIRPSRRTVSYLDSFHARNEPQIRHAYQWLKLFLGDKFIADEWGTQEFGTPMQTNAFDCGMFVITNAMCLALGVSPLSYNEDNMPIQRQRIAAMLLNGGFHGEFDLGHL
ncbi:hypothetical protein F5Y10DRAFT_293665 [Nemania abortiva]|nr:hypothetical protein F5Y10DRAFT_293665 [Nemania abortiva]